MIKSLPFWAIAFGSFAFHWTNTIMVLYTPTFIKAKLHVNIKEVSLPVFSNFMKDSTHFFVSYDSNPSSWLPLHCLADVLYLEIHCF